MNEDFLTVIRSCNIVLQL